jgi:hypothetical protein
MRTDGEPSLTKLVSMRANSLPGKCPLPDARGYNPAREGGDFSIFRSYFADPTILIP